MAWFRGLRTVARYLFGDAMFKNILVGIDGRPGGHDAVALAKLLAAPRAKLTLVNIYGAGLGVARRGSALEKSRELLERERKLVVLEGPIVTFAAHSVGRGLHELVEREGADLLAVGSCRRRSFGRVLLGSDTLGALNDAPCAVAIAPAGYADGARGFTSVGVGEDGSSGSEVALAVARELARRYGARIEALAVVSSAEVPYDEPIPRNWPEVSQQLMDSEARRLRALGGGRGAGRLWRAERGARPIQREPRFAASRIARLLPGGAGNQRQHFGLRS